MNIDHILAVFNGHEVRYLLIGGVNFLLRHKPVLTFDIDLWIEDSEANRRRCEESLTELNAEWGQTDSDWGPVVNLGPGWLSQQPVFCLTSPSGAIDIFRSVQGLSDWASAFSESVSGTTASGTAYTGLSDADMLACQLSIPLESRKNDRVRELQKVVTPHE
jgi:hypothetical protein